MDSEHDSTSGKLVPVDAGPLAAMIILRSSLEGLGLPSVVENEVIKTWYPFATGGFNFGTRLLTPPRYATEVREAIAELRKSGESTAEPIDESDNQVEAVENLGVRIRWSAIMIIMAPIGLFQACQYLARVQHLPQRPRGHKITICAMVLCLIHVVALILFVVIMTL